MAERDFAQKLARVGFADTTIVDRRPWGIADCARYPLFEADLIQMMRDLIPPERQGCVANCVTVTARKLHA